MAKSGLSFTGPRIETIAQPQDRASRLSEK
jgi:hypothetical protein